MQRRRYLELFGIGTGSAFAGEFAIMDDHDGDDDDADPEDDPDPEPEGPFGDAAIADPHLRASEFVIEEGSAYALATVENGGDAPSGECAVGVEWLDEDGALVDDRVERLGWLNAGEVWRPRIRSRQDPDEVADANVFGAYWTGYPAVPGLLTVAASEYDPEGFTPAITGTVENEADIDVDRVEAFGRVFDEEGRILAGGSDLEFELPAGRDWTFEIRLGELERPYDVVDHDMVLDVDALAMVGPE